MTTTRVYFENILTVVIIFHTNNIERIWSTNTCWLLWLCTHLHFTYAHIHGSIFARCLHTSYTFHVVTGAGTQQRRFSARVGLAYFECVLEGAISLWPSAVNVPYKRFWFDMNGNDSCMALRSRYPCLRSCWWFWLVFWWVQHAGGVYENKWMAVYMKGSSISIFDRRVWCL